MDDDTLSEMQSMTEAERMALIAEFVRKMNAFADGTARVCPECGEPVTGAICYEKIEPEDFSLYVKPCNHRLGLWSKVPEWITDVEVVPLDWREEGEREIVLFGGRLTIGIVYCAVTLFIGGRWMLRYDRIDHNFMWLHQMSAGG